MVFLHDQAVRRGVARLVGVDLYGYRHTGQQAGALTTGEGRVQCGGGGPRFLMERLHDRVDGGVHRIETRQRGLGNFGGAQGSGCDPAGDLIGG